MTRRRPTQWQQINEISCAIAWVAFWAMIAAAVIDGGNQLTAAGVIAFGIAAARLGHILSVIDDRNAETPRRRRDE